MLRSKSLKRTLFDSLFSSIRGLLVLVVGALALAVSAISVEAQAPAAIAVSDTLQALRLVDGSTFIGRVVVADDERITFETTAGVRMEVTRAQIRSVEVARGRLVNGQFWPEDPNRTRLLAISPTGRTLRQGEGYVSAFMIALPFVAYGVTDNFTIAGGTPALPEVIGRVFYLAPKLRVLNTPDLDLSVGALTVFATEQLDAGSVGILYGVGTYGGPDNSVTAGAGWGYAWGGDDPWVSNEPLIMLGGEYRVSPRVKLLTENFFVLGESWGLLTGGVRLFGERLSVDFGPAFIVGADTDGLLWFPLLNFVYNFGGRR